jgi:hypothetical protein
MTLHYRDQGAISRLPNRPPEHQGLDAQIKRVAINLLLIVARRVTQSLNLFYLCPQYLERRLLATRNMERAALVRQGLRAQPSPH